MAPTGQLPPIRASAPGRGKRLAFLVYDEATFLQ
jgi:hypothetical protein